ncbi:MAG: oligopeptide/dipeptide ABC transporter ATP-binding protein, partial [Candidatus Margulisiibacteriota bacterium]
LTKTVKRLIPIEGLMPDPMNLPNGCKFSTRCKWATGLCNEQHPEMVAVDGEHIVRCFIQEGKVGKGVNNDTE